MIGTKKRPPMTLFIPGSIEQFIPDDHILKRVDRVLDLSWLRDEVADCYCPDNGRPGIAPEAAVRLMLAGFFHGITEDRKLLREAQVNLAIRWFAGWGLGENLPDHSSLTRIRQRWGAERFKRIFQRTVKACGDAGLVSGDTVHVDATLIRANVSWESLTEAHAEATLAANPEENIPGDATAVEPAVPGRPDGRRRKKRRPKKRSTTDPDATLATSRKDRPLEPAYKQHTAVDDRAGVIVDVDVTTGEVDEGAKLVEALERVEAVVERHVERVTADSAYADAENYQALEARGTEAVIPPQRLGRARTAMPLSRFKYDEKNETVRCPVGRMLHRGGRRENGWVYAGEARVCGACPLRAACVPPSARARTVFIVDGYPALLRARRRHAAGDDAAKNWYCRHRWRVEGVHGEAKTRHGLRRAARRGLVNVAIQAYLTAAAMNLKRLAVVFSALKNPLRFDLPRVRALWRGIFHGFQTLTRRRHYAPQSA